MQEDAKTDKKNVPDEPRAGKKPYQKPEFRYERVFETMALSCGKVEPHRISVPLQSEDLVAFPCPSRPISRGSQTGSCGGGSRFRQHHPPASARNQHASHDLAGRRSQH